MKLLTLVLGLYMLALPCMPCVDSDECNEPATITVAASAGQHTQHGEEEACAPFCSCACCGHIVTSNSQTLKIAAVRSPGTEKLLSYYSSISLSSDFFGNIWQPPRMV